MPNLSHIMRRAWSLLRQSMAPYSRPAFAAHLRQAWHEARNAPVTDWAVLQRFIVVSRGAHRAEVISKLENALAVARGRTAQYRRVGAPTSWTAAKHRSSDLMRVANIEAILRAEKAAAGLAATYTAKRDDAGFVLKRNGVEFGRLIGPTDRLAFTSTDAMLAEKVRTAVVPWGGVPAALAKVRAADEALRLARIA
ncbi:hypothetical protein EZH22_06065 [Xanthobacter dioxanivorans]|uniref:Uncharacterized protein n=1 Tax=Xanthobacter dioxanivorans TaxID=2528964 RepID=A0A974PR38_9HYPH|nr:hypothetical protein [Xanthobacter dioxanivorans]QRG07926.1 hypothetical protein EZH22_06065 [Xanthobacter dioxanivorans]